MERVLMRIAVASEGLEVAPRFRQCASYMCYRVDRGIIVECQNLPNPGLAAPKLVALLVEMGVDTLIVGAIDYDVANVFCHAGIEVIAGAHGSAREVVQAYPSTGRDIVPVPLSHTSPCHTRRPVEHRKRPRDAGPFLHGAVRSRRIKLCRPEGPQVATGPSWRPR